MDSQPSDSIRYVLITLNAAERDAEPGLGPNKLREPGNNGRKIAATGLMPEKGETPIRDPLWQAGDVLVTGGGGLEIATFSEWSSQDRHRHERSTEIYTVLRGRMQIYLDDQGPYSLEAGDEMVILPGTVHEVVEQPGSPDPAAALAMLVRVHAINCGGAADKFVQLNPAGDWRCWDMLNPEERRRAWRKQGQRQTGK